MLASLTFPSFSSKEKLEDAKKQLDEAYNVATAQFVQEQTARLSRRTPSTGTVALGMSSES